MKLLLTAMLFLGLALLTFGPRAHSQSAQKLKEQEEKVREYMLEISKDLNVTCTECHKTDNFKDDRMHTFKVSREHIKIVEVLKSNGFNGKDGPMATCYMCHRGELKPAYKAGMKLAPKAPVQAK